MTHSVTKAITAIKPYTDHFSVLLQKYQQISDVSQSLHDDDHLYILGFRWSGSVDEQMADQPDLRQRESRMVAADGDLLALSLVCPCCSAAPMDLSSQAMTYATL